METLFLKLVNMSISASWLVLAVVALRFAMKKAPKWMTCALWAMVALRLMLPFSIESPASLIPDREPIPQSVITNYTPIITPADTPVSSDIPVVTPDTPMLGTQANTVTPASITETAATVWVIGVAVLVVYAAVSYLLIRQKVAASLRLRNNIYLCDYIESPFILGILRPRIYLPSSLERSQWPHVLAHEQAHLSRRDHWWKPLGFVLLCVYWFNPVLWLAYILLCRDIELACDERVIRDMDTRQKQDYTTALLECSMPRYLVAACPLAFGEVGVKERVKSVLNYKKPAFWIILIALILCVAAAVCFLTDPVGNSNITPGVYNTADSLYQCSAAWPYGMSRPSLSEGTYTLQDNSLYFGEDSETQALGTMREYDLSNDDLYTYLEKDPSWQSSLFHVADITDSLRLDAENNYFYIWFQTANGNTYLAAGWSNRISHIVRLNPDETAEEKELAWFDAIVTDSQETWLMVSPIENTWMSSQYTQISVSRYWHASENGVAGTGIQPGEFEVGDRVRIVYDGNIAESSPAQITKTYSITELNSTDTTYTVISGENQIKPIFMPVNTEISTLYGLPILKLEQNDSKQYQFQLLRDGQPNPGYFRLYDYNTKEEIKDFHNFGSTTGPDWSLLEPGRNYIVVQERDGMICFIVSVPYDFGITLTGSNITPTGMTVTCTQSGGNCPGEITYDPNSYILRRITDYGWENIPVLSSYAAFSSREIATLKRDSTVTWNLDWSAMYGALEPGNYRFDRYFSHGEPLDTYLHYSVYFTIGDGSLQSRFPDYFGLSTFKGLELYAFDEGYVLMTGTNREKTEEEINALPRATAEEMKEILKSYHETVLLQMNDIFIFNHTDRTEREIRRELGILPTASAGVYVTSATATEGLVEWRLTVHPGCEVWTGYDYSLEVYTEDGWVHYGYPSEELAWPSALRFHYENTGSEPIYATEIFDIQWSTTTGGPLPPGQYRYRTGFTVYCDGEYSGISCDGYFEVPEDSPENPGIHMEILNPTDTGATLAVTYNGGLMGELTTQGQYYLMTEVDGGYKKYGLVPSQAAWGDVLYTLKEGETVYIDVRWDHTAEAPLPQGIYCVVLTVNQTVPYMETQQYPITKQVTGTFAIID